MTAPKVSIGLPVLNGEHYLKDAIQALQHQTVSDFEVIVSDNASDDDTRNICVQVAATDKRFKIYSQESRISAAENFHFVLNQAMGSYFMWAACDDEWHPKFFESLLEELENTPNAVLAMTATQLTDHKGRNIGKIHLPKAYVSKSASIVCRLWVGSSPAKLNYLVYALCVASNGTGICQLTS